MILSFLESSQEHNHGPISPRLGRPHDGFLKAIKGVGIEEMVGTILQALADLALTHAQGCFPSPPAHLAPPRSHTKTEPVK